MLYVDNMKTRRIRSTKALGLIFFILVIATVFIYYTTYAGVLPAFQNASNEPVTGNQPENVAPVVKETLAKRINSNRIVRSETERFYSRNDYNRLVDGAVSTINSSTCSAIRYAKTDIDTTEQFGKFEFQPFWIKMKHYWDDTFEQRYRQMKNKKERGLPLKVILVPHSHNDPGWLKTFEGYYHTLTRNILNNMVDKLTTLHNMTFIWSEISFLAQWWDSAHPIKKKMVNRLIERGKLEIVTGGWVMSDEATTHIYAMLDQLIEGHQWIKMNLGVEVKTGWSVDPFGHGPTIPYLLKLSGVERGTVIQRIHYAWKRWFASEMAGDFVWRQNWDRTGYTDMLTHNLPYDSYSIKHSCGPQPQVCLYFDFRKIVGEISESTLISVPIDEKNVKHKAETLLNQYEKTASLFPHNVVLIPLGDDFRYNYDIEWDQQYRNYKRLFDYINNRKELYNADLTFGTPSDYFDEIRSRAVLESAKTLRGDFFVYADIFQGATPAYWNGFYTSRPYWKALGRQLEANLRSAEILYTIALNSGRRAALKLLERDYEKLVRARQNLALFQHHDAITGTSQAHVMKDYTVKLIDAIRDSSFLQTISVQSLLFGRDENVPAPDRIILSDTDFDAYDRISEKLPLTVRKRRRVVIFNSLAQHRQELIKLTVSTPYVKLTGASDGRPITYQINPVWNFTGTGNDDEAATFPFDISQANFELLFTAELSPLSLNTFIIEPIFSATNVSSALSTIYCKNCLRDKDSSIFDVRDLRTGTIQLENRRMRALFDGQTGFLRRIVDKRTETSTHCEIVVSAYPSAQFHSGAYLFMVDPVSNDLEIDILERYRRKRWIIINSGPIASEITVIYGRLLWHTVRIFHSADGPLAEALYLENIVDLEEPPKNRDTELFMRLISTVNNGEVPVFYTDSNGMQMQKRKTISRTGVEGNYYPATTNVYIEDERQRLSLLLNHAQGTASWQPGWLEVMLDRRSLYDDRRGIGEGVVDNKRTTSKYWLLLETFAKAAGSQPEEEQQADYVSTPSLLSNYLSNGLLYPPNVFVVDEQQTSSLSSADYEKLMSTKLDQNFYLISKPLPCDVHLVNLRTITDYTLTQFPSRSALMILHRQGFSCNLAWSPSGAETPSSSWWSKCPVQKLSSTFSSAFFVDTKFTRANISETSKTTLTGVRTLKRYERLEDVTILPMDLLTLNVTFAKLF